MGSTSVIEYVDNQWRGETIKPTHDPWYRFGRVLQTLESITKIPQSSTWLDLGCNQGQLLELLSRRNKVIPTGMDDWDPQLNRGSFRYFQRDLGKGFALDEQFDFISALEVLEHIIDTDKFLDECHKHLKPTGYLILTTPNINSLRNRLQVPLGKYPAGLEYRNEIHHVRLYNNPALKSHLSEHGFKVICSRGVSFLPVSVLTNAVADRISTILASAFPQLCNNLIVIAQKNIA